MKQELTEQQAFEIELSKELSKFFPKEFIPANFEFAAARALQYQSMQSLRVGAETYEKLLMFISGEISEITFYEISFLINCIGSATPKQLIENGDIDINYLTIQKDAAKLSLKWNEIVEPIKESTRRKVNAKMIRGINPVSNGKIIH